MVWRTYTGFAGDDTQNGPPPRDGTTPVSRGEREGVERRACRGTSGLARRPLHGAARKPSARAIRLLKSPRPEPKARAAGDNWLITASGEPCSATNERARWRRAVWARDPARTACDASCD